MNLNLLRTLPALLLSLFAFSFSSCGTVGNILPAGLADTLGQVTGLSTDIGAWQSNLSGMLDNTALSSLKGYADQAASLGSSITGMTDGLTGAMKDPLGAIGSKLANMGNINIDSIKNMLPGDQMKAVSDFASSATEVGDSTDGFLKQFAR